MPKYLFIQQKFFANKLIAVCCIIRIKFLEFYSTKIDNNLKDEQIAKGLNYLSEDRKSALKKYLFKEDFLRGLHSSLLARLLICENLNIQNSKINFFKNEYSKPFLQNFDNFYFNTAHSGEYAVCIISDTPAGIDIEKIKHIDLGVAEQVFTNEEMAELKKKSGSEQTAFFYDIWTLKESYIKAVGMGLYLDLKSFYFELNSGQIKIVSRNAYPYIFFKKYNLFNGYKCSACSGQNRLPDIINNLTFDNILLRLNYYSV